MTEQKVLLALLLCDATSMIDMKQIKQMTNLSMSSLYRAFKTFKEKGWLTNKHKAYYFAILKQHIFQGHRLEIWHYVTLPFDDFKNNWLTTQVLFVDPISLYLTLSHHEDPRID